MDVLKTRFFIDFCGVLIDDFRRFSKIFTNFDVFAHGSDCYQEANCDQMRSLSWIFDGSEQFSGQNSQNFGAWGMILNDFGIHNSCKVTLGATKVNAFSSIFACQ